MSYYPLNQTYYVQQTGTVMQFLTFFCDKTMEQFAFLQAAQQNFVQGTSTTTFVTMPTQPTYANT